MKIEEYKEMIRYLTRPNTLLTTPIAQLKGEEPMPKETAVELAKHSEVGKLILAKMNREELEAKKPTINKHIINKPITNPKPEPIIETRSVEIIPEIPVEEIIKSRAEQRRLQEIELHENEFGKGGIADLMRPL